MYLTFRTVSNFVILGAEVQPVTPPPHEDINPPKESLLDKYVCIIIKKWYHLTTINYLTLFFSLLYIIVKLLEYALGIFHMGPPQACLPHLEVWTLISNPQKEKERQEML